MAYEYSIHFENEAWYGAHRAAIFAYLLALPHFVKQQMPDEVWLKDPSVDNPWEYDVRIFLRPVFIAVEVSVTTRSFRLDVAQLVRWIDSQTQVSFLDDDGIPFDFR